MCCVMISDPSILNSITISDSGELYSSSVSLDYSTELDEAVKNEDYEKAAQLRDEISKRK